MSAAETAPARRRARVAAACLMHWRLAAVAVVSVAAATSPVSPAAPSAVATPIAVAANVVIASPAADVIAGATDT